MCQTVLIKVGRKVGNSFETTQLVKAWLTNLCPCFFSIRAWCCVFGFGLTTMQHVVISPVLGVAQITSYLRTTKHDRVHITQVAFVVVHHREIIAHLHFFSRERWCWCYFKKVRAATCLRITDRTRNGHRLPTHDRASSRTRCRRQTISLAAARSPGDTAVTQMRP